MHHPWVLFLGAVVLLLLVDLRLLHGKSGRASAHIAWLWTGVLALLACGFAGWILHTSGKQPALEFLTGYVIEGSLSVDNLFVFLILFRTLHLNAEQQHTVLLWGVMGAIVLRAALIIAGASLLSRFEWVQYVFGAFLAVAAIRLMLEKPGAPPTHGPLRWIRERSLRHRDGSHLAFRSLLLIIVAVEATDLIFALDSIPAVLAVTRDTWIAFTSNIFAVLGLRSLYFALASMLDRFHLLHYGLATILFFVAFKMLAAHWIEVPVTWSLGVIVSILAIFMVVSRMVPEPPARPRHSA
ncbi:MAG: TerC/Alx family metal homeostasis membrane protein [Acidobacteriota bacterium]